MFWSRKDDESGNATAPSPLKGPTDGSEDDEFELEVLRRLSAQRPLKRPKYVGNDEFEIEVLRRLTAQQDSLARLQWRVLFLACFFLGAALAVLLLT